MDAPFTLFSDFNCPFCYALHERLHRLGLIGRCAWRGVQHAPSLPTPLKPWRGSLEAELRYEVSVVRRLLPDLQLNVPAGKPNTANAIACAAEALAHDRQAGMALIRKIYHVYWVEGRDISDPLVLGKLFRQPLQSPGERSEITRAWTAAWEATGQTGVPLLLAPNKDMLVGCVSTEELRNFFGGHS